MKIWRFQQKRTWWFLLPIWLVFTVTICEPAYCRPMLKEGKTWEYQVEEYVYDEAYPELGSQMRKTLYSEKLEGDTLVGGKTYFKMYRITQESRKLTDLLWREEEGRVYAYSLLAEQETLRYDFNMSVGEEVVIGGDIPVILNDIEEKQVKGNVFAYFYVGLLGNTSERKVWVEGVGTPYGLSHCYGAELSDGRKTAMLSCYEDGQCIFTGDDFSATSSQQDTDSFTNSPPLRQSTSVTFDIFGRKLPDNRRSNPHKPKGIYIRDGRKVVVR